LRGDPSPKTLDYSLRHVRLRHDICDHRSRGTVVIDVLVLFQ